MKPDSSLKNSTCFPLYQSGIEGDFCFPMTLKSPLPPLLQRGECVAIARNSIISAFVELTDLSGYSYV